MSERLDRFVALSAVLTGFESVRLWGSGLTEEHLAVLDDVLPKDVVDDLLGVFARLGPKDDREQVVATKIMRDPRLGPVAKNVIILWYSGVWTQLPANWRTAHGASTLDSMRTTSGAAYRAGLQWVVAGAHPPGASHQGFGAWALEPKGRQA